ncbi:ADP-ribose pyrophosphatase [Clostridia bacterium]|nr:ADP-ribose pyrophosphatase [Clostridia bacterium]
MSDDNVPAREMNEKTVAKHTIYSGKIVSLRVDDALDNYGKPIEREVVEHPGGVGILALDDDGNALLVRQFRYGVGETVLEIPAGKLEAGEAPLTCGKRELTEETGYEAAEWMDLGVLLPTPAYDTERIYIYLAKRLTWRGQHLDESECLELVRIPLKNAVEMVTNNEITDGKTQVALLKAWFMAGYGGR